MSENEGDSVNSMETGFQMPAGGQTGNDQQSESTRDSSQKLPYKKPVLKKYAQIERITFSPMT